MNISYTVNLTPSLLDQFKDFMILILIAAAIALKPSPLLSSKFHHLLKTIFNF
jgi:hypothetical protein